MKLWKNMAVSYCLIIAVMGCGKHNFLGMHRDKEQTKTVTEKQITKKSMVPSFLVVALLLSQLTPVQGNNTALTMCNHDLRADSYLTFNPIFNILCATQDVDITTACSGQFLDTATRERCVKKCNARLTWLLNQTEPIRNRFNYDNIILYARDNSRRLAQVNSYQYPQVALTQTTADGRVKFCGWRVYGEEKAKSFKSPPDEIQKIWKETSDNSTEITIREIYERKERIEKRIEELEKMVAIMLNDNDQLKIWCNQSDTSDLAKGIMDAVTEVLNAIEAERSKINIMILENKINTLNLNLSRAKERARIFTENVMSAAESYRIFLDNAKAVCRVTLDHVKHDTNIIAKCNAINDRVPFGLGEAHKDLFSFLPRGNGRHKRQHPQFGFRNKRHQRKAHFKHSFFGR